PLSNCFNDLGGNYFDKLPFPGNGQSKIWHCPSCYTGDRTFGGQSQPGGQFGFFSYVMNIDLKDISPMGGSYTPMPYPQMPKLGTIRKPASTVFLTECCFSPTKELESPGPDRNGIFPAARHARFPDRHSGGGNIVFVDGHSRWFKRTSITNGLNSDG